MISESDIYNIARVIHKFNLSDKLDKVVFLHSNDSPYDKIDRDSITYATNKQYTADEHNDIWRILKRELGYTGLFLRYKFGGVHYHGENPGLSFIDLNIHSLIRTMKINELLDYDSE